MQLLASTGWLHHLRRHLVADVLCLGRLQQHFRYGMLWFRQTLVDHDAVLNRANWMWLAGAAFSTKQLVRHYSPNDYVQRGSHDVTRSSAEMFSCKGSKGKKKLSEIET